MLVHHRPYTTSHSVLPGVHLRAAAEVPVEGNTGRLIVKSSNKVEKNGPIKWIPIIPAQTLTENWYWKWVSVMT